MSENRKLLAVPLIFLLVITLSLGASCKTAVGAITAPAAPPKSNDITDLPLAPYIPPAYYDCIEVLPVDLEAAYYSEYGAVAGAETMYNGKYFVFKDQLVDAYMLRDLDKGWLWADLTKCPIVDIDYAKKLQIGERVDIVGISEGRDLKISPGLYFSDCYVVLSGSIQLPAPGGSNTFAPGY